MPKYKPVVSISNFKMFYITIKGPSLPISRWDVMAIVLCDGNSYNANGDGNLAYAGPLNNYKKIKYRKLKTKSNGDNSVCEFDGNSNNNFTPGLQVKPRRV